MILENNFRGGLWLGNLSETDGNDFSLKYKDTIKDTKIQNTKIQR